MYFNQRVLTTLAVLSVPAFAGNCAQSVVKQASDNKFLEFVILNCAPSSVNVGLNISGGPRLDADTCLPTFMSSHNPGSNPIEVGTACYTSFNTFVSAIDTLTTGLDVTTASGHEGCTYVNNQLKMSYVCWNRLSGALDTFQADNGAGYSIYGTPCSAGAIRTQSLNGFYRNTITAIMTAAVPANIVAQNFNVNADPTELAGHVVPTGFAVDPSTSLFKATASLQDGMCYGCAAGFLDYLQRGGPVQAPNALPANLKATCAADPSSAICVNSGTVSVARRNFLKCAGFAVDFSGPMCDGATIDGLSKTFSKPSPYEYLVKCGILKSDFTTQCTQPIIDDFVKNISETVGVQCNSCFLELKAAIEAKASDSTAKAACKKDTIFSTDCKTALAEPLKTFKECSGSDLLTTEAGSSSNNADDSTTDSSSSDSSGSPSDSSSSSVASSIVGLVVVAALSSML